MVEMRMNSIEGMTKILEQRRTIFCLLERVLQNKTRMLRRSFSPYNVARKNLQDAPSKATGCSPSSNFRLWRRQCLIEVGGAPDEADVSQSCHYRT